MFFLGLALSLLVLDYIKSWGGGGGEGGREELVIVCVFFVDILFIIYNIRNMINGGRTNLQIVGCFSENNV